MNINNHNYLALVVDDEAIARNLMIFHLNKEGFTCHKANDGLEAMNLIASNQYDLVVTDLRMPHKNGHALAIELLKIPNRPLIAVHTSVVEPQIVEDLMSRGVDDIVFKPTDYPAFTAKIKVLIGRRKSRQAETTSETLKSDSESSAPTVALANGEKGAESQKSLNRGTDSWESLGIEALPLSPSALNVYQMCCEDDTESEDIGHAIEMEPGLTAELLRLGNSCVYNRTSEKVYDLKKIVDRMGRRRVGELALAFNACAVLRDELLQHLDVELAWRRSLAAGVAVQLLTEHQSPSDQSRGLVLSAVMHLLGRVVLAKEFPDDARTVVELAEQTGKPLTLLEKQIFSATQAEVLANLLAAWRIPQEVIDPLRYYEASFDQLAQLDKPQRNSAELVKVAVLIGWLAAGRWESWDLVEFPKPEVLMRVGALPVKNIVKRTREGLASLMGDSVSLDEERDDCSRQTPVGYMCLGSPNFDLFAPLLVSLGIQPVYNIDQFDGKVILNCLEATAEDLYRNTGYVQADRNLFICKSMHEEEYRRYGETISLPSTHGSLAANCLNSIVLHTSRQETTRR